MHPIWTKDFFARKVRASHVHAHEFVFGLDVDGSRERAEDSERHRHLEFCRCAILCRTGETLFHLLDVLQ